MGSNPLNKILDFLIENDNESWALVELRDQADVGYSTLKVLIPKMLENELIEIHKTIGKSSLYRINKKSLVVKKIYGVYNIINNVEGKKLLKTT